MKVKIIPIGNSRGIRIPKPLIEQCGLSGAVALRVENHCLIIAPRKLAPRQGWDAAFEAAAPPDSEESLTDDGVQNEFDRHEWKW